jgi:hypothetical protein
MKNETAILDCVTKMITFKFNNEIFTVDIKEGDLSDSWNSITDKNGVMWDFNFSWEDTKGCKPCLAIYGLMKDECGNLTINTSDETSIKVGKASADVFFKEERFGYIFDVESAVEVKIYNDKDELVFTTKSFNRASDERYERKCNGEKTYMIARALSNNSTKRIDF